MAQNWAGNIEFSSDRVVAPATVEELQELVYKHPKVKVQGTRHSFNRIADGDGVLVSMENFQEMQLLPDGLVRVGAGVTYGQVAAFLHERGLALHNLASLPHISVAGACATATHGSGIVNGNLATAVQGLLMVTGESAKRDLVLSEDTEDVEAAAVGIGALGIVVETTLRCEPTYQVAQTVFLDLALDDLMANFESVGSAGYSVSLFTTWERPVIDQVWVKRRLDEDYRETISAEPARRKLHPLAEMDPMNCTEQLGIPGPWHERLPHFKMEYTPSAGEELQSEFFVQTHRACMAIEAIQAMGGEITPALFVSEIRFIAADGLWMSPAFAQDVVGIHFTWRKDWERVKKILPKIERIILNLEGVPHWGKLTTLDPDQFIGQYPMRHGFKRLVERHDPEHKFSNPFLDSLFASIA